MECTKKINIMNQKAINHWDISKKQKKRKEWISLIKTCNFERRNDLFNPACDII